MKIMWLTMMTQVLSLSQSEKDIKTSGGWITATARNLEEYEDVENYLYDLDLDKLKQNKSKQNSDKNEDDKNFGIGEKSAEKIIKEAARYADGYINFIFQGGEPTLAGIDFFRFFVDTVNKCNIKRSPVFYGMQTNGTVIDEEWAEFLSDNRFLVGLSKRRTTSFQSIL